jgi:1-deoxy-D-xylulose-5-phosphate reductoisomerase
VPVKPLDLAELGSLSFENVDASTFKCLDLALSAGRAAGTAPCVLNAANEIAVHAFLDGKLPFLGIADVIGATLDELPGEPIRAFETLYEADREARDVATDQIAVVAS